MMPDDASKFDFFSPTDYRYNVPELVPFLSEEAFVKYKADVEAALVSAQAKRGLVSPGAAQEVGLACNDVRAAEVYAEEDKTRHDIIALRNMIQKRLGSDEARSAVHRGATSFDIVETANAARYRDAFNCVIIPDMIALEKVWIGQAREYADTLQIGRTHLQHAEPITYGFYLASLVSRFGNRILNIRNAADGLRGKFSGSVGAYNASSLFFDDPEVFEDEVVGTFNLDAAEISSQIAPLEPLLDLVHYTASGFGVLANWTRDMRNLQRPEIAEVGQPRGSTDTSASSIMPHKVNPVGLENIESLWKASLPFVVTMYLDQISDHQRDLTNSASQRYVPAFFDQFDYAVRRAARVAKNIKPHPHNMQKNLDLSAAKIVSEPLQILLSSYGHPDAHHHTEKLVADAEAAGVPLFDAAINDKSLAPYIQRFTDSQLGYLRDPSSYTGIAAQKARKIADIWERKFQVHGIL